jgi:hypothetical protein
VRAPLKKKKADEAWFKEKGVCFTGTFKELNIKIQAYVTYFQLYMRNVEKGNMPLSASPAGQREGSKITVTVCVNSSISV